MKDKINIGLFIDTFFPMIDGVINVVDNYAKRLNKIANVTVFAPKTREKFDDSNLTYKVVRSKSSKVFFLDYDLPNPNADKKFKDAIKEANLDIIHIHSPFTIGKMASTYAKRNNIPVVATFHSQFERDFMRATRSKAITKMLLTNIMKVFNSCDECWTMNPACVKLLENYGYKGKTQIVPNGTDLRNNFSSQKIGRYKQEIKAKYNIKDDEKIFLNIGRINKLKNIGFVIDVCEQLKLNNFKFKLFLIGDGQDKNYFVEKIKKQKLKDEIIFTGKITSKTEKNKFFSVCDLQVFPSYYDTDGIVKIEAAAFKLPTILIENSIASSSITDSVNGYIGENDAEKFAKKIIEIFENKENYELVKENCYKDLYISWDDIIEIAYKKYLDLIKNKCSK